MATEAANWDTMAEKVAAKIESLRRQLDVQELLLAEIREHREAAARGGQPGRRREAARHPEANGQASGEQPLDHLADQIADSLRKAGKPQRLSEIVADLEARGVTRPGGQSLQNAVFGAMRRRTNRFRKVHRGVYELIE